MWSLLVLFSFVLGTAISQATTEDIEKVKRIFEDKCQEQGAPNAITSIQNESQNIEDCISNRSEIIEFRMAETLITGSKGKKFAAYCKLWPELYNCMTNITVIIESCLTEIEQQAFDKSLKDSVTYLCYRNGKRKATFIDNGGIECVTEQQKDIMKCVNSMYGGQSTKPGNISDAISPTLTEEQCQDFNKLRQCINVELKECEDPTPATIVDDLIQFWSNKMSCAITNSAVSITKSILVTLAMFLLVQLH